MSFSSPTTPNSSPSPTPATSARQPSSSSRKSASMSIPQPPQPRETQSASIAARTMNPQAPSWRERAQRDRPRGTITEDWQSWPEARIRIQGLPSRVTTVDLYRALENEGDITFIDFGVTHDRQRTKDVIVVFTPPPRRAFWGIYGFTIKLLNRKVEIAATLVEPRCTIPLFIRSPVNSNIQYPRETTMYPAAIHFGFFWKGPGAMMAMKTVTPSAPPLGAHNEASTTPDMRFLVDLQNKRIQVFFPVLFQDPRTRDARFRKVIPNDIKVGAWDRKEQYRMNILFQDLSSIAKVELGENKWALVLYLGTPPFVWKRLPDVEQSLADSPNRWRDSEAWRRSTAAVYLQLLVTETPASLNNYYLELDFGRWTTYMIMFEGKEATEELWPRIERALGDFNVPVHKLDSFDVVPRQPCGFWKMLDEPRLSDNDQDDLSLLNMLEAPHVKLDWELRYQLETCISLGVLNEYDITREFLETLATLSSGDTNTVDPGMLEMFSDSDMTEEERAEAKEFLGMRPEGAKNAATLLLESITDPKILKEREETGKRIWDPMSIFGNRLYSADLGTGLPYYCAYARKAIITPSAVILRTPSVEITNRVIRQYSQLSDRFLRVQFADEKGRIYGRQDKSNDEIWARVYDVLDKGIEIGDRKFQFLACGSSQMREHGAYFFCPGGGETPASIRAWMGDFQHILVPAKYSARLGQCFSTTRAIRSIQVPRLQEIPDIERNGKCFTDGVGKISHFLAQLAVNELSLDKEPSAFQIRLGGCKGMLVVWPDMKGSAVEYRLSQKKFDTKFNGLEVIRNSQFSIAYLNRQTITILECLGVRPEVFLRRQAEQMALYKKSLDDPQAAIQMLTRVVDQYEITMGMANMVKAGFFDTKEPFLRSLLLLWKAWSLKLMKEKARILIDKGAFLFGVVDELGVLQGHYDAKVKHLKVATVEEKMQHEQHLPEIFLRIPDHDNDGKYVVITGICVVGRNPSLHPGDLRVVMAVDRPELRHLKDVVVFPSTGDRDIAGMCSGGDLDGDDYFVFWDEELIPSEWNYPPMDYTAPPPVKVRKGDRVQLKHLIQFFVQYMKNDSLPQIARAHLAKADSSMIDGGPKSPHCLQLCQLHSRAVDYVKTGCQAEMPSYLRPKSWPHFMEKPVHDSHKSESALGQLYDEAQHSEFQPEYNAPFDQRILRSRFAPSGPEGNHMLRRARRLKTQYDTAMRRLMGQREIKTEFEIFTAFVMSKPRVGSDYELQNDVGWEAQALKRRFRGLCMKEVGGGGFERLAPLVAAMYQVTKEEVEIALKEAKTGRVLPESKIMRLKRRKEDVVMPLTSFPWVLDNVMCRIASLEDQAKKVPRAAAPVITVVDSVETKVEVVVEGETKGEGEGAGVEYVVTDDGHVLHHGVPLSILGPRADLGENREWSRSFEDLRQVEKVDMDALEGVGRVTTGTTSGTAAAVDVVNDGEGTITIIEEGEYQKTESGILTPATGATSTEGVLRSTTNTAASSRPLSTNSVSIPATTNTAAGVSSLIPGLENVAVFSPPTPPAVETFGGDGEMIYEEVYLEEDLLPAEEIVEKEKEAKRLMEAWGKDNSRPKDQNKTEGKGKDKNKDNGKDNDNNNDKNTEQGKIGREEKPVEEVKPAGEPKPAEEGKLAEAGKQRDIGVEEAKAEAEVVESVS